MIHKISHPFILMSVLSCTSVAAFSMKDLPFAHYFTQDQEKTVPESLSIAPQAELIISHISGNILIQTWNHAAGTPNVMIEATKKGSEDALQHTSVVTAYDTQQNIVTIATQSEPRKNSADVDYVIMIPHSVKSLTINTAKKGTVTVKGFRGSLTTTTAHGDIKLHHTTGSINARAPQGSIKIKQKNIASGTTIFAQAHNHVTIYIPRSSNALFEAKTLNGSIVSEIPLTLSAVTSKIDYDFWQAFQKHIYGTFGMPDATIHCESVKGIIKVLEY